ncbi:GDSL-type esterase/lipase family protein [Streptomyces sp. NPDC088197]|uniref:GDSL-type esterase/lipase family protein n=1 Tax=Streptomyces sp. NPDC088197 TaxID=3365840 RepID=UPI0038302EEF
MPKAELPILQERRDDEAVARPRRGSAKGRWLRRGRNSLLAVVALLAVCVASIWLAVRLTPMQSVTAAGQTVEVGAVAPDLSLSGPGELDLFGEALATEPHFQGPIRPRLKLADISINSQVNQIVRSDDHDTLQLTLSRQLAAGWIRYCVWELLIAAGCAAVVAVAVAGIRRAPRRTTLTMVGVCVLTVSAVNALGVYLMASGTPQALRQVRTLDDLVGRAPTEPVAPAKGPQLTGVHAVVLGDSTAAGIGNQPVEDPSALDKTCGRSSDAFAAVLGRVNDWNVLNLACQGATVTDGLLGVQLRGDQAVPPQLAVAQRASSASVIIVSVGANDMNWAVLTGLCAKAPVCDDKASTAYFKEQLSTFSQNYLDLLQQLSDLPHHPDVLINQYYEPFGADIRCLEKDGLTEAKVKVLKSRLANLNAVLQQGADAFHFATAQPDFEGHRLCSEQPFVQNAADQAPLHPTAAGELAIALADQQALAELRNTPSDAPTDGTSPGTTDSSSPSAPVR